MATAAAWPSGVSFSRLLPAWQSRLNGPVLDRPFLLPAILATLLWQETASLGQADAPSVDLTRAEALARQHCAACRLFPEPALLDKKTWGNQVMPRMAIRMGLSPESINRHPEADALWKSGRFPKEPILSQADYRAIAAYYQAKAPAQPVAQKTVAPIGLKLSQFTARPSRFRRKVGAVNLVRIDEQRRQIIREPCRFCAAREQRTTDGALALKGDGAVGRGGVRPRVCAPVEVVQIEGGELSLKARGDVRLITMGDAALEATRELWPAGRLAEGLCEDLA